LVLLMHALRGWSREVERRCTSERVEKLVTDLGQPISEFDDSPEDDLELST
jgi:hypothetical protein